ncbi:hypothetical protein B0H34DRAFT_721877 [Crassisporium funariophilum]|nr:hypothetical protein B0H34DRAFT_721877 [Crassisporium funariophilum]
MSMPMYFSYELEPHWLHYSGRARLSESELLPRIASSHVQLPFRIGYLILMTSFSFLITKVHGQTWCGKNYLRSQELVLPVGRFEHQEESERPFLALRCLPRVQPYLPEDVSSHSASILVDTSVTFTQIHSASLIESSPLDGTLELTIEIESADSVHVNVPVNVSNWDIPLSLNKLEPRTKPYSVKCTADIVSKEGNQTFVATSLLSYLPDPVSGSVTKLDRRTGALLTKSVGGAFEPIFPIGFYTNFGKYLAFNISILDELKAQGFNTVHPVPPFDDTDALVTILDHMEGIGLQLMYDMRHTYQNPKALSKEIEIIRHRPNLLLWYTADEPDGTSDLLTATRTAYDIVQALDGYHPVSLALNCADYFFPEYVSGADVILPDVYMIGNNATFSTKYHTPCTPTFGCCGCDDCEGRFEDISKRLDETRARLRVLGWDKTKVVWAVTQAFGGEEFWSRAPTGREWLVQAILSIIHGARGIIPWIDPTPNDIKQSASKLAKVLPQISNYIFDPEASFSYLTHGRVDVGLWSKKSETLVLVTNLDVANSTFKLDDLDGKTVKWLLQEGVRTAPAGELSFEPLGSAAFVMLQKTKFKGLERDEL